MNFFKESCRKEMRKIQISKFLRTPSIDAKSGSMPLKCLHLHSKIPIPSVPSHYATQSVDSDSVVTTNCQQHVKSNYTV